MERNYAPADTRLRAVVARERKMPQVLMEARKNLTNPPRIFTESQSSRSTVWSHSSRPTCINGGGCGLAGGFAAAT
jgi:hypothetical protein